MKVLPALLALAAMTAGLAHAQVAPPTESITVTAKPDEAGTQNGVSEQAQTVCPLDQTPPNGFACGVVIYEVTNPKVDPKHPAPPGPQYKLRPIFRVTFGTNDTFDAQAVAGSRIGQIVANDSHGAKSTDKVTRLQVLALTSDGHVAYANTDEILIPAEGGLAFRGVLGLEAEAKRFCGGASVQTCEDEHLHAFDYRGRISFCAAEEIWGSGAADVPLAHSPAAPMVTSNRSQCAKRS